MVDGIIVGKWGGRINMTYVKLAASIFECFVITEFTSKCLIFKNARYKYLKYILYTAVVIFFNLFVPQVINLNVMPAASPVIAMFVFGLLFMRGSPFFTLFVVTLSNIGLIVINVSVTAAFNYFAQFDPAKVIVNQPSTQILLLFIAKFLYFLYTRFMLTFFEREKYPLSVNEWYIIISLLTISLLVTLVVFGINLFRTFNPSPTVIAVTANLVIVINIVMYTTISL